MSIFGLVAHFAYLRYFAPSAPMLLLPKYILLLLRSMEVSEGQWAYLRYFAPSAPMLLKSKYILLLHRSMEVSEGQWAYLRYFAPSAPISLFPKYILVLLISSLLRFLSFICPNWFCHIFNPPAIISIFTSWCQWCL